MRSLAPPRKRKIGPLGVIEFAAPAGSPTIVCLHGYGADAADLAPFAAELDLAKPARWVFPDAPLVMALDMYSRGRAWFAIDEAERSRAQMNGTTIDLSVIGPPGMAEAVKTLEDFLAALNQPWDSLILGGFSQGAMLALELALHAPKTPRGLFLLSSTLVDEPSLRARAPARQGLKFFQSHGTDDTLLSYAAAGKLNEILTAGGLVGELLSFPGGHGVPPLAAKGLRQYLDSILSREEKL